MLRDYAEKLSYTINIDCCNDFSFLWPSDHQLLNIWCIQPLRNMTSVGLNMQALILEQWCTQEFFQGGGVTPGFFGGRGVFGQQIRLRKERTGIWGP
jgi:hypothetical protein